MRDVIASEEYKGHTIEVVPDVDCGSDSPREWGRLGTILTFHKHGEYGEMTPDEVTGYEDVTAANPREAIEQFSALLKQHHGATVVVPVWHYTHSGMTIRAAASNPFHCQWDSGIMGLIFDTPAGLKECGTPADRIEECLTGEVKVYDQYLSGEVYGYVIKDADDDEVDALWGIYGEEDEVIAMAKQELDATIAYQEKEAAKIARMMAL